MHHSLQNSVTRTITVFFIPTITPPYKLYMDSLHCSTFREAVELHPLDLRLKRSERLSLPAIVECTRTFLWLKCHPKTL